MRISLKNWEKACELQKKVPVADLHSDLPGELLFWHRAGERHIIRERYLPVWKRSGICLIGAAVYLEDECLPEGGLRNAMLQIEALMEEIKELEDEICLIRSRAELEEVYKKKKIGILLYMEGLDFLGTDVALLELLYELGVRGAALVWSRRNLLACGCCRADENRQICGGITEEGRRAIEKMQRLGMFLDISHLNDDGMKEVLEHIAYENTEYENAAHTGKTLKVLATHSNGREVHRHYRNLSNEQIKLLTESGGIIGINACSLLTGSAKNRKHLEMLLCHSRHLLQTAGEKAVCLGLDLCHNYELAFLTWKTGACMSAEKNSDTGKKPLVGNDALSGYDELVLFTAALLEDGIAEETVQRILGENAFAFLRRVFAE